jgi:4-hydroxy-tetrahydrodipicolinate synthase
MQPIEGVIAPNLTFFNDDLSIATDLYVAHARRLMDGGCAGLAPFGTTGEALSVGIDERIAALGALVEGGLDPAKMVPGTGLTNLADTARLSSACLDAGCAGVMVLPPFYFKDVPDDGLYAYFARLIEKIGRDDLKIYLYHIPQVAGVGIPVEVVRRLRKDFPGQIVGIKDSSGDWENTRALLEIEGLIVYPGSELPLIEALELGAPGCITATANLNARAVADVVAAWRAGDRDKAKELHEGVRAFRLTVQGDAPIPAQKRLLAMWLGDARLANLRPPLLAMSEEKGRALAERLREECGFTGIERVRATAV